MGSVTVMVATKTRIGKWLFRLLGNQAGEHTAAGQCNPMDRVGEPVAAGQDVKGQNVPFR